MVELTAFYKALGQRHKHSAPLTEHVLCMAATVALRGMDNCRGGGRLSRNLDCIESFGRPLGAKEGLGLSGPEEISPSVEGPCANAPVPNYTLVTRLQEEISAFNTFQIVAQG